MFTMILVGFIVLLLLLPLLIRFAKLVWRNVILMWWAEVLKSINS